MKNNYSIAQRNAIVEANLWCIDSVIRQNRPLMRAARLEYDDVYQQLALRLIKAWGFSYKTAAFVWLKLNKKSYTWFYGLGFWTRGNAELCLFATRGHPKRKSAGIHQFIISPIEQHSKKPDITREKIIALMGDIPRIELFARQETAGWDTWGNETKNSIEL